MGSKNINTLVKELNLLLSLSEDRKRISEMKKSNIGEYTVLGIDKFDQTDWIHGKYKTAENALNEARKMTKQSMAFASDSSIATVYYAYDPKGNYLGGDVWSENINNKKYEQ